MACHIPSAINLPFAENWIESGDFPPPAALQARFTKALGTRPPGEAVFYCGSGVTAAPNLLATAHAGLPEAKLYPGS